ncbi:TRAP transporter large permease [Halomonas sp. Choline-3u-9]|uniref:TRAP transporter large permease n=1 Tax=unclassified Halomonas TaxID=2609666 RepID=UPI0004861788|nr:MULTISPECIES: TRAP transporter large permease [unclassified Halomonas]PKH59432.1 TRAP transporter large permease [Halomonas sp. Choline-3u-9]
MSPAIILTIGFVGFLVLGVPVAIAMGMAAILSMLPSGMPLSYVVQSAYSAVNDFTIIAVPMFILAGALMEKGGLTERLIIFSRALVGPAPGGLATVTILACTMFAAISGSGPATTAAIGSIMIPAMIKEYKDRGFSSAITASAGGIGVVIPPSIPIIIYGITSETSITALFVAGVIPGLMLALALYLTVLVISKKRGFVAQNTSKRDVSEIWRTAKEAKWSLFAPVIILGGIYLGVFTVTEASIVAVYYALFVGVLVHKAIKLPTFIDSLTYTARVAGTVMLVLVTGRVVGRLLSMYQIPQQVSSLMLSTFSDPITLILVIVALLIFVGMWMETLTQIIILTPLLLPVAIGIDIHPIQFGIMFVIACEIGYSTPPLGVNLFVASEIGETTIEKVSWASLPFIGAEMVVLLLVAFVPQFSLALPELLGLIR